MNTITRFDERVEQLRLLSPVKARLLALIVEAMIREAQERRGTDDAQADERRQHHTR
jgi:hypothetical protein